MIGKEEIVALIVNADDFGISEEVNRAIDECFDRGLITRTTLMSNMPAAKAAMELAARKGYKDRVGLHLNLTAGRPLTKEMAEDKIMCDEKGFFTGDFARSFKMRMYLNAATSRNIERELRAQLDEYARLGGSLYHIDSHHHVHTDPSIWRILRKLLKDYPVSSVRLGRNMYRGGNVVHTVYKKLLNSSISEFGSNRCELFGLYEDYEKYFEALSEADKWKIISERGVEIMVHPLYGEDGRLKDLEDDYPCGLDEQISKEIYKRKMGRESAK